MKKIYLLSLLLIAHHFVIAAGFNVTVQSPNSWGTNKGSIIDPSIELTPRGMYCEVAVTFSIAANTSLYKPKDTLEGVINFDIPANSFMHDSWLWLDNNTIIRAAVVEKTKAIQVYEGIVKRRRDPSLLLKTGPSSYSLNVFPMTTLYPRKMKIVYSVPFEWIGGKLCVPVTMGLFRASNQLSDVHLKVNTDNLFGTPYFLETPFTSLVNSSTPYEYNLTLSPNVYNNLSEINLVYNTQLGNGVFLGTYPLSASEQVYQLGINPAVADTGYTPRNIVLIVDHGINMPMPVFYIAAIRQYLKTFMLKYYNERDSFNVFYVSGNVVSAFSGWHSADSASVVTAINSISEKNYEAIRVQDLLKKALAFSATRPGINTQSLFIAANSKIAIKKDADTIMNQLKAYLGGTITNKVHIINNTMAVMNTTSGKFTGSELFLTDLATQSNGTFYNTPALATDDMFRNINRQMSIMTSAYNVSLPLGSGYSYDDYDIAGIGRVSNAIGYNETGKYMGAMGSGPVKLQIITPSGLKVISATPSSIYAGDDNFRKAWVNKYMIDMLAQNGPFFIKEVVDSSKRNRVLCDSTAFLALETGDTINLSKNSMSGNGNGGGILNVPKAETQFAKLYPNPFTDILNIECTEDISGYEVYDMSGRKVYAVKLDVAVRSIMYNGRNAEGAQLMPGVYMIIVHSATQQQVYKINKL